MSRYREVGSRLETMTITWSYDGGRRRGNSIRRRACNGGGAGLGSDLGRMVREEESDVKCHL
eukprot:763294-Hanusia_phi.AAC.4